MTDIAKVEERMLSGEPFTYGQLCKDFCGDDYDFSRKVDALIQKLRRRGKIYMTREGRYVVWRLRQVQP